MLEHLHLKNVGPAPEMEMELAPRLNLITGDNGLGKSFLLDILWWALTRRWPAEVNPQLSSGLMARPRGKGEASISFRLRGQTNATSYRSTFDRSAQAWSGASGRPSNPALVLYADVDGGFAVWDPSRNSLPRGNDTDGQLRAPAYVFTAKDVWNGLKIGEELACTGLLFDWVLWQSLGGEPFSWLEQVLTTLSPPDGAPLTPGPLARVGLNARDIPTLRMPYGMDVPIVQASAGIRRILSLAYLLVWALQEHKIASIELERPQVKQIVFLVDEVEAHLHPRWQRQILQSMLGVTQNMLPEADVQLVVATHSALILASAEPIFDPDRDRLFHLAMRNKEVSLREEPWAKQGDVTNWLVSDVFGLAQGRSLEAERAIEAAEAWMRGETTALPAGLQSQEEIHAELVRVLAGHDAFWPRWIVAREKGADGHDSV